MAVINWSAEAKGDLADSEVEDGEDVEILVIAHSRQDLINKLSRRK